MDYSEEQKIESTVALIVFLFIAFVSFGGACFLVFNTMQTGGDFNSIIWLPPIIFMLEVGLYFFIFNSVLETEVNKEGFVYRYFPITPKRKTIPFNTIVSWKVEEFSFFKRPKKVGFDKSIVRNKITYNMSGNSLLEIVTNDGKTFVFSTNNPYNLAVAIKKHIPTKEIHTQ